MIRKGTALFFVYLVWFVVWRNSKNLVQRGVALGERVGHNDLCGDTVIALSPKYVVDEHQQRKAVMVTADEWEHIVSELEELDDIRAYDEAQRHAADKIPFELAVREIEQDCQA
jgi:hypothetical protein